MNEVKKCQRLRKTIFIEEALHRLVEINYHIGLEQEANSMLKY